MTFSLPDLPYDFGALEPHIDARTMDIHYNKHHAAYVNNLNAAVADTPQADTPLHRLISDTSTISDPAIRNNGGGHLNHSHFWTIMSPEGGGEPSGALAEAITETFGGFPDFQQQFKAAALTRFGSGWAWLSIDDGNLIIESTPNQDSPLMDGRTPILGVDVWEHAYYLNYQNRRNDYVDAFFNVVDWNAVAEYYTKSISS